MSKAALIFIKDTTMITKLVAHEYHGLEAASKHLASVTIAAALTNIVTTPQGWLDIREYGDPMISNALDQIALEIDGIGGDSIEGDESGDETFEAIVGALRPLVRDRETLDAILYDAFDVAYDASVLVRERLLKRAEAECDQATMDALDRPFFSPAEWAARKGLLRKGCCKPSLTTSALGCRQLQRLLKAMKQNFSHSRAV
jgi:hypothetical protein